MFDDLRSQVTPFDDDGEPTTQPQRTSKTGQPASKAAAKTATARNATTTHTATSTHTSTAQVATAKRVVRKKKKAGEILLLGMTSVQRFVLAMMMFMIVAVFGFVLLLLMQSIVLPL